jgi:hypothetical protein
MIREEKKGFAESVFRRNLYHGGGARLCRSKHLFDSGTHWAGEAYVCDRGYDFVCTMYII